MEKHCERCSNEKNVLHTKCTTLGMLPETKYVVVKIDRFNQDQIGEEFVNREVLGAITGFKADDVSVLGEKLRVCAAVVYDSATGYAGHYYTYVRNHGEKKWLMCSDTVSTGKSNFVTHLKRVSYMILERQ